MTWDSIKWAFTSSEADNWHPVTWISHIIDYQLFKLKPWGHHLGNILLHAVNTALLYLLLWSLTGAVKRSFFVAALFGIHPLHVESVAWVSERKDVLSTFFWLLMMMAYVRYARGFKVPGSKFKVYYGLGLLFLTLGLMSKPMVVTAPFVLLLLDYWPLRRISDLRFAIYESKDGPKPQDSLPLGKLVWEKAPFFLIAGIASYVTYAVQKTHAVVRMIGPGVRVENALISYCRYVGKLFCPINLAVYYPHPGEWPLWMAVLAAVALLVVSVAALALRFRAPYFIMGWLWFLGTLVPTIGLVQVGAQAMADRYMYVPSIGLFIVLAWGLPDLAAAWKWPLGRRGLAAAGLAALAGCSIITLLQLRYWKNSEAIFRRAVNVTEENYIAEANLGIALTTEPGKLQEAIALLRESLRIAPNVEVAQAGLARALWKAGDLAGATEHFVAAGRLTSDLPEPSFGAGTMLVLQGKPAEAVEHFQRALRLRPEWAPALKGLGDAMSLQGDVNGAIEQYLAAARMNPNDVEAQSDLAVLYSREHKMPEAISRYREVLRLQPDSVPALNNLAWMLATDSDPQIRNGAEAVSLAERACKLNDYKEPGLIGTLGAALAEAGRFDEAVKAGSQAEALATTMGMKDIAANNEKLVKMYRNQQAFHEAAPGRSDATPRTGNP